MRRVRKVPSGGDGPLDHPRPEVASSHTDQLGNWFLEEAGRFPGSLDAWQPLETPGPRALGPGGGGVCRKIPVQELGGPGGEGEAETGGKTRAWVWSREAGHRAGCPQPPPQGHFGRCWGEKAGRGAGKPRLFCLRLACALGLVPGPLGQFPPLRARHQGPLSPILEASVASFSSSLLSESPLLAQSSQDTVSTEGGGEHGAHPANP